MPRDLWKYALLAALVLAIVEGFAFAAGRIIAARGLFYVPESEEGYDAYLERRDPLLGWPALDAPGKGEMDASGSRVVPSFPDPTTPSCVALFGDSFTWGDEVGPADAYGNVLAKRLGCRVANYGVGGYGTDQAFLRYRERIRDPAPVVVLGHFAENVIRNVNRFRGFLSGGRFGLKPRFLRGPDGALELLPLAQLSAAEYAELWRRPELLPNEYFLPGGAAGVTVLRFPYTLSLLRVLGHYRFRSTRDRMPSYAQFYEPGHPSGALPLTTAILVAFWREAQARGQTPVVALIPDEKDLVALQRSGRTSYASLEQALREQGVETPPVAEKLLEVLHGRVPCALYVRCGAGHFTPEGYAELARVIGDWIEARAGGAPRR
jgi:hypothetical protein